MASYPVHASAKGLKFDIGFLETRTLLFAGPSNAGLTDPANIALISFLGMTVLLLLHEPYLDEKGLLGTYIKSLFATQVLQELVHEAQQEFLETHRQLMREEFERRTIEENN